ncbi:MAG: hypothetical protein ACSHW7_12635 [Patiriisocius sp.]|uniref:hypothetical protein n=1 Tax=Patiriisocius sp. TaxID=2822396 RepID=UPI003EF6BF65
MKKIHTIYLLLFGFLSQAQNVIIPDGNFKSALVNTICTDTNGSGQPDDDVDTNNDGEIQISEAKAVTHLFVGGQDITSLMGIEEFTNLEFLFCDNNGISTLSFLQNPNLNALSCSGNNLIDLDITQNPNLELLYSLTNPLVNLDISQNTNLTHLIIPNNEIISLDLSQNENLIFFDAENNQLINLDISQNPNLLRLNVKNNQLVNLNVNIGSNENLSVMIALDNPNLMCINVFDEDEANSTGCFSGGTQG